MGEYRIARGYHSEYLSEVSVARTHHKKTCSYELTHRLKMYRNSIHNDHRMATRVCLRELFLHSMHVLEF
jgi:hypothetical protein